MFHIFEMKMVLFIKSDLTNMKIKLFLIVVLFAGLTSFNSFGQRFKISIAEWSFHKAIEKGEMTNMDFPKVTKTVYGLDGVEYVSTFFDGKGEDKEYLSKLKSECAKYGVNSLIIMVDDEGDLGDTSVVNLQKAVENHYKWVKAAQFLGCHSIRVNARGNGTPEQVHKAAVIGLGKLSDYAAKYKINVIVENHGGYSSNGAWLAGVMKEINKPNCGTLPDLGNFYEYDRYKGVAEMMPYAKGVSGKTREFDQNGNETVIDYPKMLKIIADSKYKGYIDVEYEGEKLSETDGTKASIALVKKVIAPYNN
jgi:sugar phosphate isomerase/epimerase